MLRVPPSGRLVLCLACAACLALAACGEMKPRQARTVPQPPPPPASKGNGVTDVDKDFNSSSTLGKARDTAVRGIRKAEDYQKDVAKQADEVFKKN